jgi:thiol-disulfide isomerase/thioredoxin
MKGNREEAMVLRIGIFTLVLLVGAGFASAQSLGDVARKEKKRREQNQREGAAVRVVTEDEVGVAAPGPSNAVGDIAASPRDTSESGGSEVPEDVHPQGTPAADFSLPDRAGRTVSLRDLRGRPVLIDFWATWCGPCQRTMPEIERLHQRYRGRLEVVGINLEGRTPEVLAFLDKGGYSFRVLFDSGNFKAATASRYGVQSIPRTYLLDRDGRILFEGHPQTLGEEQIQAALAE